jgi:hypothetical protein
VARRHRFAHRVASELLQSASRVHRGDESKRVPGVIGRGEHVARVARPEVAEFEDGKAANRAETAATIARVAIVLAREGRAAARISG